MSTTSEKVVTYRVQHKENCMKKTRSLTGFAVAGIAIAGMLALAGCSQAIGSQADAQKAAEAVGYGTYSGYSDKGNTAKNAKVLDAARDLVNGARATASATSTISLTDTQGGKLTLAYYADVSALGSTSSQDKPSGTGTACGNIIFTYDGWHSQDKDGNVYTLSGTANAVAYVYASSSGSLSGKNLVVDAGLTFMMSSNNMSVKGDKLAAKFALDMSLVSGVRTTNLSSISAYYSVNGKVGDYSVSENFTLSAK
jgi:hypothetical protein